MSKASLQIKLTGTVVPGAPITGRPQVGISHSLPLTVTADVPIARYVVDCADTETITLDSLDNSALVAGKAPATATQGWLFVVKPNSSGTTPAGYAILDNPSFPPLNIGLNGIFMYVPNRLPTDSEFAWDITFSGGAAGIQLEVFAIGTSA